MSTVNILTGREYYKPFEYPWAFDYYRLQSMSMHWVPEEVPLHDDVRDWNHKLSAKQKDVLTKLMTFFTQSDVDVGSGYYDKLIPMFKKPELRMMLGAFANMESVHQHAYAHFTDTIGLPVSTYKEFYEYEAMKTKHEYLNLTTDDTDPISLLKNIAIYSAFTEGLQLFSSFAILLKFPHENLMKGMGQIVSYSIKDETVHVRGMLDIYTQLRTELSLTLVGVKELTNSVTEAAVAMVGLEDKFLDIVLGEEGLPNLCVEDMKLYNRYIADRRLLQLGLSTYFDVKKNPLPWLNEVLGVEFADFFSTRPTAYQKGGLRGDKSKVVF